MSYLFVDLIFRPEARGSADTDGGPGGAFFLLLILLMYFYCKYLASSYPYYIHSDYTFLYTYFICKIHNFFFINRQKKTQVLERLADRAILTPNPFIIYKTLKELKFFLK